MDNQLTTNEVPAEKISAGIKFGHSALLILICAAIVICEYVFAYQNVAVGIGIALGLVILIYIVLSVLHLDDRIVKSAESLALIPLYILFTSSLPWFFVQQQYLIPAVYSCILALCFWYVFRNNLSLPALLNFNKRKLLKYLLISVALGVPSGMVEYFILRPAPSFPTFQVAYLFRDIVYMLFFVGLAEELLFRGLIQREITTVFGWKWALFGVAALFAAMHLTWRSVPELGFVFAAGLIMGVLYLKTKGLVACILFHAVNNVMLVSIAPYLFMK